MYIAICKIDRWPVQDWCMKQGTQTGALGQPRGMGWGGRWERGSGWGTHVHPWLIHVSSVQFSSVQSLSRVWLFATPWIAAPQASLSIINSQSLPKPMSIDLVIPFNHLILCRLLLLLLPILPSIRVLSNESILHVRWPKYWSFSFNISPSNEHPGLSSFMMDWLNLLAVMYGKNHYNIVK